MHVTDDLVVHRQWIVGDLRMHVVEAGEGPLVVLLHGFPDFWFSWRRQVPALVAAGYRVVAPDLRGYARTEAPRRVDRYGPEHLVDDVAGLITAAGERRATLVGHDWGGIVSWLVAGRRPDLVERVAICNAPHPTAYRRALASSAQALRSWYAYLFMLPAVPERLLRARSGALLRHVLRAGARRPDSFSDADLDRYVTELLGSGDLTGPINYYRATGRQLLRTGGRFVAGDGGEQTVGQPVLVLWGEQDPALAAAAAEPPRDLVPDVRVVRFPEAGHWVHLDADEAVNAELLGWLAA